MKGEFLDVPFPFTESLGDKRNLLFFLYDRRILGHEFADSICRDSG